MGARGRGGGGDVHCRPIQLAVHLTRGRCRWGPGGGGGGQLLTSLYKLKSQYVCNTYYHAPNIYI